MSIAHSLLEELEHESVATRRLLEALPEDRYDWQPHAKGMSLGQLAGHIAGIPGVMVGMLGGAGFDASQMTGGAPAPTTRTELLAKHDASMESAKAWLSSMAEDANSTWRFTKGDVVMMEMPRHAAIRTLLHNHLYHHRGQLSAHLRAVGAHVPSVYGPTADDNPFA